MISQMVASTCSLLTRICCRFLPVATMIRSFVGSWMLRKQLRTQALLPQVRRNPRLTLQHLPLSMDPRLGLRRENVERKAKLMTLRRYLVLPYAKLQPKLDGIKCWKTNCLPRHLQPLLAALLLSYRLPDPGSLLLMAST